MPKKGRGPKPNKGQRNTKKSEKSSYIGPSFAGRKSKQTQSHHARTVHLDSGNNHSGVTQNKKVKKEANSDQKFQFNNNQPSSSGSGPIGGTTMVDHEDHAEGSRENQVNDEHSTFGFPIVKSKENVQMKNISPSNIPHFHGKDHQDPDSFVFEFDILCQSYDYSSDAHKLKLFPTTLKDSTLHWFMGLGGNTISSWEQMKRVFLNKY